MFSCTTDVNGFLAGDPSAPTHQPFPNARDTTPQLRNHLSDLDQDSAPSLDVRNHHDLVRSTFELIGSLVLPVCPEALIGTPPCRSRPGLGSCRTEWSIRRRITLL